jgi:hypothetical protein
VIRGTNGRTCGRLVEAREGRPVDPAYRQQIAAAARLLRSIRPPDGDVEIRLHEIARQLEHLAETGEAGGIGARSGTVSIGAARA